MRVVSIFFRVCGGDIGKEMKIRPFRGEEGSGSVEKVVTTFENHDLFLKANRAERKKAMGCQPEMLLGEHYGWNSRLGCPRLKAEGLWGEHHSENRDHVCPWTCGSAFIFISFNGFQEIGRTNTKEATECLPAEQPGIIHGQTRQGKQVKCLPTSHFARQANINCNPAAEIFS